ncbi:hypothetical protein ACA351_07335 [Orientia tsutsugamushi]|uniref:hypothetical protein n=1 Tax=Orientia tsutsugamushi TaxID=784 RepID=UPI0035290D3F
MISELLLDNLEKLLSPARIIEAHNITGMLLNRKKLNICVLKKTLKVLTLNINILKVLYDLDIPFSILCSKLHNVGSNAPDLLAKIFKIFDEMIKVHKNDEEFLISFETFERQLYSVKYKSKQELKKFINSAFEKINSQEPNNLTINSNQSQIIDKHGEDDIEKSSNEINTYSDSQELTANISNSELTTNEILNRALAIDYNDIKEIELELNNYMTNQFESQSKPVESYQENNRPLSKLVKVVQNYKCQRSN